MQLYTITSNPNYKNRKEHVSFPTVGTTATHHGCGTDRDTEYLHIQSTNLTSMVLTCRWKYVQYENKMFTTLRPQLRHATQVGKV